MASGFGESTSRQPQSPSCSDNNGDASNFECNNICLYLAPDPIVTLCGRLFCWRCLYKWLQIHSHSHECPVCKAIIEDQKLVPLYGRGKTSTDPRSKSIPGINIPNRPAGQRPESAGPPPEPNPFPHNGFGFMGGLGGYAPMASASFGNFTLSVAFGVVLFHPYSTFRCMDMQIQACMVRLLTFHMDFLICFMVLLLSPSSSRSARLLSQAPAFVYLFLCSSCSNLAIDERVPLGLKLIQGV